MPTLTVSPHGQPEKRVAAKGWPRTAEQRRDRLLETEVDDAALAWLEGSGCTRGRTTAMAPPTRLDGDSERRTITRSRLSAVRPENYGRCDRAAPTRQWTQCGFWCHGRSGHLRGCRRSPVGRSRGVLDCEFASSLDATCKVQRKSSVHVVMQEVQRGTRRIREVGDHCVAPRVRRVQSGARRHGNHGIHGNPGNVVSVSYRI